MPLPPIPEVDFREPVRESVRDPLLADPYRQIGELQLDLLGDFVYTGGVSVQIAGENPNRVALYAQAVTSEPIVLQPFPDGSPFVVWTGTPPFVPVVVHIATHTLLTLGPWWATGPNALTVRVWEVTRSSL